MSVVQQGFLVYDSEWLEVSEQELNNNTEFYKSKSIFNPISAKDLQAKDPELLNKMFEPYVFQNQGKFYRLRISRSETSRSQLDELEKQFQQKLKEKQARKSGICPIRQQLHNELFDEIIRQASVNLPERGILLMRVRDNLKMTFAAYQTLYQGSLVFGSRKLHVAQQDLPQLTTKVQALQKLKTQLQNQKIILENQLQSVQLNYRQVKIIQDKAQNDQLLYLNNQTKRLEQYLNGIYGD